MHNVPDAAFVASHNLTMVAEASQICVQAYLCPLVVEVFGCLRNTDLRRQGSIYTRLLALAHTCVTSKEKEIREIILRILHGNYILEV